MISILACWRSGISFLQRELSEKKKIVRSKNVKIKRRQVEDDVDDICGAECWTAFGSASIVR